MSDKKTLESELAEIEQQIDHLEVYEGDAKNHIYRYKLSCDRPNLEEWERILQDIEQELESLREQEATLIHRIRRLHIEWVCQIEESGRKLHEQGYNHGWPKSPKSRLMYLDGDVLVFPRDHGDRYSSHRFWLDTIIYHEPIICLGQDYFSSEQLGVTPDVIDRLYELEQLRLQGNRDTAVQEEIEAIRGTLRRR
uniref:Uncharacterized protein n=1 Tax=viral metagenome TaxID=1070528 RepID=A0A6C0AQE4_9ZZZZ